MDIDLQRAGKLLFKNGHRPASYSLRMDIDQQVTLQEWTSTSKLLFKNGHRPASYLVTGDELVGYVWSLVDRCLIVAKLLLIFGGELPSYFSKKRWFGWSLLGHYSKMVWSLPGYWLIAAELLLKNRQRVAKLLPKGRLGVQVAPFFVGVGWRV